MYTSDEKDMLMQKLAICEFGCRNILYLMFESFSIYFVYQKSLIETVLFWNCKAKYTILKIKAENEKIKKEVWMKYQCRNNRWWRDMWSPQSTFLDVIGGVYWTFIMKFILELHHCFKLLRALSKSWTRSSDHLNFVFESAPAAATCSLALLAILFFIELFRIQILLFCCCFLINLRMG